MSYSFGLNFIACADDNLKGMRSLVPNSDIELEGLREGVQMEIAEKDSRNWRRWPEEAQEGEDRSQVCLANRTWQEVKT